NDTGRMQVPYPGGERSGGTMRRPVLPDVPHDAVLLVRADHVRGDALQRGMSIRNRHRPSGDLEDLDVVELVAEHDELLGAKSVRLDERAHALCLGCPAVVDREPVPAWRVEVLEEVHLDARPVPLADRAMKLGEGLGPIDHGDADDVLGERSRKIAPAPQPSVAPALEVGDVPAHAVVRDLAMVET